jgi:hypothetical protein
MKLANIVSNSKINLSEEFNVVKSIDDKIDGLPTLIVGFDLTDKIYPNFDVLKRELEPNVYWTFKKTERRDDFEEVLRWFNRKIYKDLIDEVIYIFVDPLQYRKKSIIKLIKKIKSLSNPITYKIDNMIYVYGEKYIFGIDLNLLKFIGMDVNKIISKIKCTSSVFLHDSQIIIEYKKILEAQNLGIKYIPYLYSIHNEQNTSNSLIYLPREKGLVS